jgi:glucans biosynthesis protein
MPTRGSAAVGDHRRHTTPMLNAPRCGAKTRSGTACLAPAAHGKARCRMHGGTKGSGAPRGNRNALKDGLYTHDAMRDRRALHELVRRSRELIDELK